MPSRSSSDRVVHGRSAAGWEIVRYDRAGKWYVEGPTERRQVTLAVAVELATGPGARAFTGLSGGNAFDRRVARVQQ